MGRASNAVRWIDGAAFCGSLCISFLFLRGVGCSGNTEIASGPVSLPVVDMVGAGDGFTAGLISACLEGIVRLFALLPFGPFAPLDLQRTNRVGAQAIQVPGDRKGTGRLAGTRCRDDDDAGPGHACAPPQTIDRAWAGSGEPCEPAWILMPFFRIRWPKYSWSRTMACANSGASRKAQPRVSLFKPSLNTGSAATLRATDRIVSITGAGVPRRAARPRQLLHSRSIFRSLKVGTLPNAAMRSLAMMPSILSLPACTWVPTSAGLTSSASMCPPSNATTAGAAPA